MKKLLLTLTIITLAGCMSDEGVPIEQAVKVEKAKAGPGLPTVIAQYKAKNYKAAFNALPDQALAKRMRASSGIANIATKNNMSKEQVVVEELLCTDYNSCDVVTG